MAWRLGQCAWTVTSFLWPLLLLRTLIAVKGQAPTPSKPLVPALFVFGDSLSDPGNNNYLKSLAKADFQPYGRQFDTHKPTGRFTNGRTPMDALASLVGLPLLPAFLDPEVKGERLLQGVNYASAGAGILNETGRYFGQIITLSEQLGYFRDRTQPEIYQMLGKEAGDKFFRNSLYYFLTGANDYTNGYYFYIPTSPPGMDIPDYVQLVTTTLSEKLTFLYNLGARKVGVAGAPAIGCCPSQRSRYNSTGPCVNFLNDAALKHNVAVRAMLPNLRATLPDFLLIYNNIFDSIYDASNNPHQFGFQNGDTACCGIGKFNGGFTCLPTVPICADPENYMWFDSNHPTDKMYRQIADFIYYNGPPFSEPYSGQYLVSLQI